MYGLKKFIEYFYKILIYGLGALIVGVIVEKLKGDSKVD